MIITEYLNDETLVRHYSDENFMILQNETGIIYSEAFDVVPCKYTYTETNTLIVSEEKNSEPELQLLKEKAAAYDIIVGGVEDE